MSSLVQQITVQVHVVNLCRHHALPMAQCHALKAFQARAIPVDVDAIWDAAYWAPMMAQLAGHADLPRTSVR